MGGRVNWRQAFLSKKNARMHGAMSSSACPDSSETFDWIHLRFQAQSASIFFHGWYVCPWIHAWTSDCLDDPNSFCIFLPYICESFLCTGFLAQEEACTTLCHLGKDSSAGRGGVLTLLGPNWSNCRISFSFIQSIDANIIPTNAFLMLHGFLFQKIPIYIAGEVSLFSRKKSCWLVVDLRMAPWAPGWVCPT